MEPKYKIGDKVFWTEQRVQTGEVSAVILVTGRSTSAEPYYMYVTGEIGRVKDDDFDYTIVGTIVGTISSHGLHHENELFPSKESLLASL